MLLFLDGERVDQLVARVERRVDGPASAERVLEVIHKTLEEVERTREDGEQDRLELRAPRSPQRSSIVSSSVSSGRRKITMAPRQFWGRRLAPGRSRGPRRQPARCRIRAKHDPNFCMSETNPYSNTAQWSPVGRSAPGGARRKKPVTHIRHRRREPRPMYPASYDRPTPPPSPPRAAAPPPALADTRPDLLDLGVGFRGVVSPKRRPPTRKALGRRPLHIRHAPMQPQPPQTSPSSRISNGAEKSKKTSRRSSVTSHRTVVEAGVATTMNGRARVALASASPPSSSIRSFEFFASRPLRLFSFAKFCKDAC